LFNTELSGFKIIIIAEQTELTDGRMADMAENGREK